MGQKDHNITLEEMENGIIGSCGILAEVGRRIERLRRNQAAKDLTIADPNKSMESALQETEIQAIGWDSLKRALTQFKLKETLEAELECILERTEANMLNRAAEGDFDAEKFVLERKCKDKGWGKEKTINHKGSAITVNISKSEDGV